MKRKSSNVRKLKITLLKDKKIINLYNKLKKTLTKNKKINSFTVAVSGGSDSMALSGLSIILANERKYKVFFAHVDHGLRKNSNKEAIKVKKLFKKNNTKLEILKNKRKITKNIQKNARDLRYDLLSKFCKKKGTNYLLTAHHQDDQIETFFIRLSRGSGVEGLSSMDEKTKIKHGISLIRPFLNSDKKDLIYVAKKFFKQIIKDPSNTNKKFLRVNIRNLKKILEDKGISPERIAHSIRNISLTKDAINFYVIKSMKELVKFRKAETILNLTDFKKEPKEVKFRIMNNIIKKRTNSYYPPRSKKVVNLINRFEGNKSKKCTLGGCLFEKRKNLLYVSREF
tara:strand:- start:10892 stop:11914 length:1023 start_codon:yes stop_codon:yes gene_type:complete